MVEQHEDTGKIKIWYEYDVRGVTERDLPLLEFLVNGLIDDIRISGDGAEYIPPVNILLKDSYFRSGDQTEIHFPSAIRPHSLLKRYLIDYLKETGPGERKYIAFAHRFDSTARSNQPAQLPVGFIAFSVPTHALDDANMEVFPVLTLINNYHDGQKIQQMFLDIQTKLNEEYSPW